MGIYNKMYCYMGIIIWVLLYGYYYMHVYNKTYYYMSIYNKMYCYMGIYNKIY